MENNSKNGSALTFSCDASPSTKSSNSTQLSRSSPPVLTMGTEIPAANRPNIALNSSPRGLQALASPNICVDAPQNLSIEIQKPRENSEIGYESETIFRNVKIYKKTAAEAIATFILIFTGCGAIMVNEEHNGVITQLGVSSIFGLVVATMIYSVGHISGAHMNPAVSIAFSTIGNLPWKELPMYLFGQFIGAMAAAVGLKAIIGNYAHIGALTNPEYVLSTALLVEFIISFALMFVVVAVATDPSAVGHMTGLVVGAIITANALFAGPVSGAAMNPVRALAPAMISGYYEGIWIFIVGPIIGALCGAWGYKAIQIPTKP